MLRYPPILLTLVPAAMLSAQIPSPTSAQSPVSAAFWPAQGRDPGLTRWSPLRRIGLTTVADLRVAWTFSTGSLGPHEGSPLVIDSLLFLHTPYPTVVTALDLSRPGASVAWRWTAPTPRTRAPVLWSEGGSRGLAWHPAGRIYVPLLHGELAALDAATGRELWRVQVSEGGTGATLTGAPLVAGDVVLVGVGGSEFGVRGFIAAFDAATGRSLWIGRSTGPDSDVLVRSSANAHYPSHQGPDLGQRTWPAAEWTRGGGDVTGWLSWDPELDLVYYGTGAPAPWNAEQRPGDNKWTSTVFAREVRTGRVRWAYQTTPHDEWGYGAATEAIVADLQIQGAPARTVVQFNPNGFAYTFDRASGKVLLAERYGPANWASRLDLRSGLPQRDPAFAPTSTRTTEGICPAVIGGKHHQPAAFSPAAGLFFVPLNNLCMTMRDSIVAWAPGRPYIGASVSMQPGPGGNRGRVIAWDAATGGVRWELKEEFPVLGGMLATAGGLVFYGTLDGWLKAVDQVQGRERWRFKLPSGVVGSPIVFATSDGREYLAVLSGVGGWAGAGLVPGARPTDALGGAGAFSGLSAVTNRGGTLIVFELGR